MKLLIHIQVVFCAIVLGLYFLLLWLTGESFISAALTFCLMLVVFGADFGVVFFIASVIGYTVTLLVHPTAGLLCALAIFTTLVSSFFGLLEGNPKKLWLTLILVVAQCSLLVFILLKTMIVP